MEITTTSETSSRQVAINALAVVGFVVLLLLGIMFAVYSARYVPVALSRVGAAAVSLSSVFRPSQGEPQLQVITATTTPGVVVTGVAATSTEVAVEETTPTKPATPKPTAGAQTQTVTTTVKVPVTPFGKPDLTTDITAVGYCTTNETSSFRRSSEIPDNENGGVKFTIKNSGTNVSGRWDFEYELPTSPVTKKTASSQSSLNPGDAVEFTLCFTKPRAGDNRDIAIRVDTGKDVDESNENNNTDSATVSIES
jgi:subtilase family serine protease